MKQETTNLAGICGLYCGTCPQYLAPREKDLEQLRKISEQSSLPIERIRCDGCLSDRVFPPCEECRHGFRGCAAQREITWCFQCPDFPCQRLKEFVPVHVVNGISHHEHVIEDLQYMKEHGVEKWVEEQHTAGSCPQCGKMAYWFVRECPGCQARLR